MKKLWFRFSWDWRNKMDKTRWPQVILALLTRRRTAAGHVALALLPSQRAMLWKPRCVRGLKWRNMEKLEGRKGRPWKLGGFLGCNISLVCPKLVLWCSTKTRGLKVVLTWVEVWGPSDLAVRRMEKPWPPNGLMAGGLFCRDSECVVPRCFPWDWWSNCELQKGPGLGSFAEEA